MYELKTTTPDSLEFVSKQSTLVLKLIMFLMGSIGVFLLLLAILFLWLKGISSASFQVVLGFAIFFGGASLLLRNHLATIHPEPAKIIITSRSLEFLAPDGSLQLRLPATEIEDFAVIYEAQSKTHSHAILCLRFRHGSLYPLQGFLRHDLAAEQLAWCRENLRTLRISKTLERDEAYPALQQVATLNTTHSQASLRYPLSSYRSLLLPAMVFMGFALAFLRILYEVLGTSGVAITGLIGAIVLFLMGHTALSNSGAIAELVIEKDKFSYHILRENAAQERLRSPLATFRAVYLPNHNHGYVTLFRNPQDFEQQQRFIYGKNSLPEGFKAIGNALRDLLAPEKSSSLRLPLPGFNHIQQLSLAMWLNQQQQHFTRRR